MKSEEKKPLRASMPDVAAFIDACREAFGATAINASIKAGLSGQPTFYAEQGGRSVGTKAPPSGLFRDGGPIDPDWYRESKQ